MQVRTFVPSEDEFRILKQIGTEIRCHRDPNFPKPHSKTSRVQERFVFARDGTNFVLEHYANGLRSLKAPGWFFVFPYMETPLGHGSLNVHDEERWLADMTFLKMAYA